MREVLISYDIRKVYEELHTRNAFKAPPESYFRCIQKLKPISNTTLLDIGCGDGVFISLLKDVQTFGIDLSRTALKKAVASCKNGVFLQARAEALPFRNSCLNYITCLGSLEHFQNYEMALSEIKRVIKPKGKLLILVPNLWFISHPLKEICYFLAPHRSQPIERAASLKEWIKIFTRHNLRLLSITQDNDLMLPGIVKWMWKIIACFLPKGYSYQFLFLLEKI